MQVFVQYGVHVSTRAWTTFLGPVVERAVGELGPDRNRTKSVVVSCRIGLVYRLSEFMIVRYD